MAYILALIVALGSFAMYMVAFVLPEVHRKNDFIWSGVGLFYALVLWLCAGRITGGVLLGQSASVVLLGYFAWETFNLRFESAKQRPDINFEQLQQKLAFLKPVLGLFTNLFNQVQSLVNKLKPQPKPKPVTPPKTDVTPVVEATKEVESSESKETEIKPETPVTSESKETEIKPETPVTSESKETEIKPETPVTSETPVTEIKPETPVISVTTVIETKAEIPESSKPEVTENKSVTPNIPVILEEEFSDSSHK